MANTVPVQCCRRYWLSQRRAQGIKKLKESTMGKAVFIFRFILTYVEAQTNY